ncbi:MAG: redoxin family protein [Peptostreptococcaceae bacterium]|nr:redoxin family protein [Peptostreptococcaceae bacterium]MBP3932103.1 redoxin family protein [Peptostreptococcaceae bacterium]
MENLNLILVFIEGLLSFFSPCVLPIIPVYISILSNSSQDILNNEDFKSSSLLKNTIFFTLGICTTFFLLSMTIGVFSQFFIDNKNILMLIGGVLIVFMGIFYMELINIPLLQRDKRLNMKVKDMNILTSYLLGFTFSFGWTPCIGPMLASVIIMASGSESLLAGNLLVGIYSIGFILPFIIVAIFYKKLFEKFNNTKKYLPILKKIGGIILIISGLIMIYNGLDKRNTTIENEATNKVEQSQEDGKIKALDFTLYDQYGNTHTLSEYEGKTVFLNIWATWCPPCKQEMPYIEELYKEYNLNKEDVVILGLASPYLGKEGSKEDIKEFLNSNKYTFPVVFDENADLIYSYGIQAFPTTFVIDKEGYIAQYVPGGMTKEIMKTLIESVK